MNVIQHFAEAWQPAIWRASWQGAVALVAAWIICHLLRRAPAAIRCWIWRLAYLKMLVALFWASPLQLPLLAARPAELPLLPLHATSIDFSDSPSVAAPPAPAIVPSKPHWTLAETLLSIWLLGLIICIARIARAGWTAHRWRRNASPCDDAKLLELFNDLRGSHRRPTVLYSKKIDSPLLIGLFRPAIILPQSIIEQTSPVDLRLILAHESAHAKRLDLAWDWLAATIGACFFFHPFVWFTQGEWRLDREIACDELARATAAATPSEYGRALVNVISQQQRQTAPTLFALGIGERAGAFRRRIKAMKTTSSWTRKRVIFTATALLAVSAVGTVPWQLVAAETPATQPVKTQTVKTVNAKADPVNTTLAEANVTQASKPLHAVGTVSAAVIDVRAPVDGKLRAVEAKEGKSVKEHDLLFAFDEQRQAGALEVALAELQSAEAANQRARDAGNTLSVAEKEQYATAVRIAQAKANAARAELMDRRVGAPVAGVVTEVNFVADQYVSKGTLLTTIVNNNVLKVDFSLLPEDLSVAKVGDECRILNARSSRNERLAAAKIVYVAPRITESTGGVRVRALVASGAEHLLPGMTVDVEIGH